MKSIPHPRTEFGVIKRYLHVLALLQNNKDPQNWNGTTLADFLSCDEEEPLSDRAVREYIRKYLEEEMGISVDKITGGRRTELAKELEGGLLDQIAALYATFVVENDTGTNALKALMKRHPHDGLWIMARLYFAAKMKNIVTFDYTTNTGSRLTKVLFHPWYMVIRNNNLYLVGKTHGKQKPWLIIMNRIENLSVTNDVYEENPVPAGELFGTTLGSWIGQEKEVTLRFHESVHNQLAQVIDILDPDIVDEGDGSFRARFMIQDDIYLLKQLFLYGNRVEVLKPKDLRERMTAMLQESLSVYN